MPDKTIRLVLVSAFMLLLVYLAGCGDVSCENTIRVSQVSPDRKFNVIVFNRNCGATTGLNTQVALLSSDLRLANQTGNVLIADGILPLEFTWKSDSELLITGTKGAHLFKRVERVAGVVITYE